MKETKKEPTGQAFEIPMMSGVNLPQIEVRTFDGTILNWRPFREQFQAAVHNKPHLGDVDKLTYDTCTCTCGMHLRRTCHVRIQGLTQTAESYGEAIECLTNR